MARECLMCDGEKEYDGEPCTFCEESGFEIDGTDNPVCPHCGYEQVDDHGELSLRQWSDGEEATECCNSCGKDYHLTLSVSYSFSTSKTA